MAPKKDAKYEKGKTQILSVETTDTQSVIRADDAKLADLGYKSEFRREFTVSNFCRFMKFLIFSLQTCLEAPGDNMLCVFDNGGSRKRNFHAFIWPRQWYELASTMISSTNA